MPGMCTLSFLLLMKTSLVKDTSQLHFFKEFIPSFFTLHIGALFFLKYNFTKKEKKKILSFYFKA